MATARKNALAKKARMVAEQEAIANEILSVAFYPAEDFCYVFHCVYHHFFHEIYF
jgi:hypothetical protein